MPRSQLRNRCHPAQARLPRGSHRTLQLLMRRSSRSRRSVRRRWRGRPTWFLLGSNKLRRRRRRRMRRRRQVHPIVVPPHLLVGLQRRKADGTPDWHGRGLQGAGHCAAGAAASLVRLVRNPLRNHTAQLAVRAPKCTSMGRWNATLTAARPHLTKALLSALGIARGVISSSVIGCCAKSGDDGGGSGWSSRGPDTMRMDWERSYSLRAQPMIGNASSSTCLLDPSHHDICHGHRTRTKRPACGTCWMTFRAPSHSQLTSQSSERGERDTPHSPAHPPPPPFG